MQSMDGLFLLPSPVTNSTPHVLGSTFEVLEGLGQVSKIKCLIMDFWFDQPHHDSLLENGNHIGYNDIHGMSYNQWWQSLPWHHQSIWKHFFLPILETCFPTTSFSIIYLPYYFFLFIKLLHGTNTSCYFLSYSFVCTLANLCPPKKRTLHGY